MKSNLEIKKEAEEVLRLESQAILRLADKLNDDFAQVVQHIINLKGRVIVTGIGKSAIIAQKIVATLNSTGTPSIFMHAADAIHGDLGIIQQDDLVIALSKSGTTPEIKVLVPLLKQRENTLVAIVGNTSSFLAQHSDYVLDTWVEREACPNNLAPTTSTTAQLAMGDALAVCLQTARRFTDRDFAKYHPGGALGKQLYLKVSDLSHANGKPSNSPDDTIRQIIVNITKYRLGATAVLENDRMVGIVTDGDIRRMLENHEDLTHLTAKDIMSPSPKTIEETELAVNALQLMREHNISQLLVTNGGNYAGIVHIQDLLKEGLI